MRHPDRRFRPQTLEVERRQLLTAVPAINGVRIGDVGFVGGALPQTHFQQDGSIHLQVYCTSTKYPVQVRVTSDPAAPGSGVNFGPVDQTVTFTSGGSYQDVTVPVFPGATNPGEVDVALTLTPINPPRHLTVSSPLDVKIFASKDVLPPTVVSAQGTPQGIVLGFSKPMDPAGASNVKNYALVSTVVKMHSVNSIFGNIAFYATAGVAQLHPTGTTSTRPLRIKSAHYDPTTNTVTLVPQAKLSYKGMITVTQGPAGSSSVGLRARSSLGPRLTDTMGNAINNWSQAPGTFSISVDRPA